MTVRAPLVAFHAPMKGPDHPVPSGDRTVARLYVSALRAAGFEVEIASVFRAYDGAGDPAVQADLMHAAAAERARLAGDWRARGRTPDIWFTYHLYHKAPDLLGPDLTQASGMAYAVAEPSHAPKRATGPWAGFYRLAEAGIRQADALFVVTGADAECVAPLRTARGLVRLPPFIDDAGWDGQRAPRSDGGPVRLITVAMMRAGDKLHSYRLLAEALAQIPPGQFTLEIVGDGPARGEVEAAFAFLQDRVIFCGEITDRSALSQKLADADVYVWPAVNEAYGMAFLEAQVHGLPVVAGREGGVSEVVRAGETGLLTPPRDAAAFAASLAQLIADVPLRARMGQAARAFVTGERLVAQAATVLRRKLWPLARKVQS